MTQYLAIICIALASAAAGILSLPADAAVGTQWELPALAAGSK